MKKLILFLSIAFQFQISFAQQVFNDANAEARQVPSFHGIEVLGAFNVELTQGNEIALAVSANEKQYTSTIRTEVENGILKIWSDEKGKWWKNRKLRVYISVKELDLLKASGASDFKIIGSLNTNDISITFSGASDLKGILNSSGKLKIELTGASDLDIKGSAIETFVEARGASNIKAYDFQTGTCNVNASGASDVHITVDKELSVRLSGASNVSYRGKAIIKDIKTSGASSVSKKS